MAVFMPMCAYSVRAPSRSNHPGFPSTNRHYQDSVSTITYLPFPLESRCKLMMKRRAPLSRPGRCPEGGFVTAMRVCIRGGHDSQRMPGLPRGTGSSATFTLDSATSVTPLRLAGTLTGQRCEVAEGRPHLWLTPVDPLARQSPIRINSPLATTRNPKRHQEPQNSGRWNGSS
jgi:hypothetical protein